MAAIWRLRQTFFTWIDAWSWISQQDNHGNFRHFEYMIDAIAEILMDVCFDWLKINPTPRVAFFWAVNLRPYRAKDITQCINLSICQYVSGHYR